MQPIRLLLLSALALAVSVSHPAFSILATSLNIRYDCAEDGLNQWAFRKNLVAETLLKGHPDILGTQEGLPLQQLELAEQLPGYRPATQHRLWMPNRMYPSIYVNSDRIDLLDSGDKWLSKTPDVPGSASFGSVWPRLFTWARVREKTTGRELFIVNTHLDERQSRTREAQARVLVREIQDLNWNRTPMILMGDFNEGPFGRVRETIMRDFPDLRDPWEALRKAEEPSFHGFGSPHRYFRIDWILADQSLNAVSALIEKATGVHPLTSGKLYPSDHFAIRFEATPQNCDSFLRSGVLNGTPLEDL